MSVQELRDLLAELAGEVPAAPEDPIVGIGNRIRRARRRARFGGLTLAAAVVVVAALLVLDTTGGHETGRVVAGPPTSAANATTVVPAATAAQLAGFHWSQLPGPPVAPGAWGAVAWAGEELFVWDGQADSNSSTGHAAAYDPRSGHWQPIAVPVDLTPRENSVTLWTGREVLVIGGDTGNPAVPTNDGAYDPATNRWRILPPRPTSTSQYLIAVWTGQEAIVVSADRTVAAYSPGTNRWSSLPALPEPAERDLMGLIPVWTGSRLLLWTEWSHTTTSGNTTTGYSGIDLWRFTPETNLWSSVGSPPETGPVGIESAIWTGREVLLPASDIFRGGALGPGPTGNRHGYLYDPAANSYRQTAHGPVDDGARNAVWAGDALLRLDQASISGPGQQLDPGDAAVWNPDSNTWTSVPRAPAPYYYDFTVWTGHEILALGNKDLARFGP